MQMSLRWQWQRDKKDLLDDMQTDNETYKIKEL